MPATKVEQKTTKREQHSTKSCRVC